MRVNIDNTFKGNTLVLVNTGIHGVMLQQANQAFGLSFIYICSMLVRVSTGRSGVAGPGLTDAWPGPPLRSPRGILRCLQLSM